MSNPIRRAAFRLPAVFAVLLGAASAQAEIKSDAIRIGVVTDMSGMFATAMGPGSVEAARMAAEEFGGAIDGKPIVILQADTQNKPDVASSIVREWFDRDHVQTVADGGSSSTALAIQAVAREKGRVFLISGAGAEELSGSACAPLSVQWTHDSYSTATAVVSGSGSVRTSPGSSSRPTTRMATPSRRPPAPGWQSWAERSPAASRFPLLPPISAPSCFRPRGPAQRSWR